MTSDLTEKSGFHIVSERRMTPRVAARLRSDLYCLGRQDSVAARSLDIGSGGVCVETASAFDPSSLRRISIDLPDGPVQSKAVAHWQRQNVAGAGFLTGISFHHPTSESAAALLGFVNQRAQEISGFLLQRSEVPGLDPDQAMDIASFMRVAEFPSDSRIYGRDVRGARGDSIFVVFDGPVLLEANAPGCGEVRIESVCVGGVFGGLPLIGETPQSESAIALSHSILLEIDPYTISYLRAVKPHVVNRLRRALLRDRAIHLGKHIECPE